MCAMLCCPSYHMPRHLRPRAMSGITRLLSAIARYPVLGLGVRLSTEPADKLGKDRARRGYCQGRTSTAYKSRRYRASLSWPQSRFGTLPASSMAIALDRPNPVIRWGLSLSPCAPCATSSAGVSRAYPGGRRSDLRWRLPCPFRHADNGLDTNWVQGLYRIPDQRQMHSYGMRASLLLILWTRRNIVAANAPKT